MHVSPAPGMHWQSSAYYIYGGDSCWSFLCFEVFSPGSPVFLTSPHLTRLNLIRQSCVVLRETFVQLGKNFRGDATTPFGLLDGKESKKVFNFYFFIEIQYTIDLDSEIDSKGFKRVYFSDDPKYERTGQLNLTDKNVTSCVDFPFIHVEVGIHI